MALALVSFVFILLASVTGIILAAEPISEQLKLYPTTSQVTIGETIQHLKKDYPEVLYIAVNQNNVVSASVFTEEGTQETFYIHPKTAKKIGEVKEQAPIFSFATNLHRSLFLKTTGRFLIGLASFILLLIALSGIILLVKRQGTWKHFFKSISKENVWAFSHAYFSRLFLIPILLITATGVYLSLQKFEVIPSFQESHELNEEGFQAAPTIPWETFPLFQETSISEIRKIEFPFSEAPEDYFLVQLKDREVLLNQFTGSIMSEVKYPLYQVMSVISLRLHTGRGSILWSVVLGLACMALLYFIFSGFKMTLQRKANTKLPRNRVLAQEAEQVVLVGSETGNTFPFAASLQQAIQKKNQKVFITQLNDFQSFPNMKQLYVLTSTYGNGEAPSNASLFFDRLKKLPPSNTPVGFSVVGFGSVAYPNYCAFAERVQQQLTVRENFSEITPLYKINNQSWEAFKEWGKSIKLQLGDAPKKGVSKTGKTISFKVIQQKALPEEDTFVLQLKPQQKCTIQSGDLWAFTPPNETRARLYSIGKINNDVFLSIKKHPQGIASNFLSTLQTDDSLEARLQSNKSFHFPKKAAEIIMISNGTGIAPFLGMLETASEKQKVHLYWGGRNNASFSLYEDILKSLPQPHSLRIAFSRQDVAKVYVQHLLWEGRTILTASIENGAVLMICGSITMQQLVLQTLSEILKSKEWDLSDLQKKGRLLMDTY